MEETVFYRKNGITVTNMRIEHRGTMHVLRYITTVQCYREEKDNRLNILMIIAGGLCLALGILHGEGVLPIIGVGMLLFGVLRWQKDDYFIQVRDIGGMSQDLYMSCKGEEARQQMEEVKDAIVQALLTQTPDYSRLGCEMREDRP